MPDADIEEVCAENTGRRKVLRVPRNHVPDDAAAVERRTEKVWPDLPTKASDSEFRRHSSNEACHVQTFSQNCSTFHFTKNHLDLA